MTAKFKIGDRVQVAGSAKIRGTDGTNKVTLVCAHIFEGVTYYTYNLDHGINGRSVAERFLEHAK